MQCRTFTCGDHSSLAVRRRPGLRPGLIRASRVLPSTRLLFQSVERHFLLWLWRWRRGRRDGLGADSSFPMSEGKLASRGANWLSATAFEKPHSLPRGNRLILQVKNYGNQRSTPSWSHHILLSSLRIFRCDSTQLSRIHRVLAQVRGYRISRQMPRKRGVLA